MCYNVRDARYTPEIAKLLNLLFHPIPFVAMHKNAPVICNPPYWAAFCGDKLFVCGNKHFAMGSDFLSTVKDFWSMVLSVGMDFLLMVTSFLSAVEMTPIWQVTCII